MTQIREVPLPGLLLCMQASAVIATVIISDYRSDLAILLIAPSQDLACRPRRSGCVVDQQRGKLCDLASVMLLARISSVATHRILVRNCSHVSDIAALPLSSVKPELLTQSNRKCS